MDSKKYQVFISSTYSDLVEERDGIIKAILEMYHIPIGMEMFSAEDEDQWEIIRRTIEVSDYYILVLGLRYGTQTSDGISYTQKEYQYALEMSIPILAFVMDESLALPSVKRDDDLTDILNFRNLVLHNSKMAQFWSSKEELIKNVSISLMKQIIQKPAIGWVRGDKVGIEQEITKELASTIKENRELREKISDLEARFSPKIPVIEVTIEPPSIDEKFDKFTKILVPERINTDEIEPSLKHFIEPGEIERFNSGLPNQRQIDQYNSELEIQYKIEHYSTPLKIRVANEGTVKANNLFVELTFPEGILIYSIGQHPAKPKNPIPISPIVKARLRVKEKLRSLDPVSISQDLFASGRNIDMLASSDIPIPTIYPKDLDWWTNLEGNKLTITLQHLLHTRAKVFGDDYMIVPLNSENHQIKVDIICEEYQEIETDRIEMALHKDL
ncbi:DUF4062 domain-containing protein [Arenicella xantha]|uniref:Uncharacterized protein DUF4062 n=1 Tax=Arenicella xantha TaxID=644221 RepID=A0A395JFG9_9GAMM|nr:DUF4062 domain-containing protein [Arenicella xantha]RBP48407.1 uncharacterized protein DUF4062 [Arenicella xantha]